MTNSATRGETEPDSAQIKGTLQRIESRAPKQFKTQSIIYNLLFIKRIVIIIVRKTTFNTVDSPFDGCHSFLSASTIAQLTPSLFVSPCCPAEVTMALGPQAN